MATGTYSSLSFRLCASSRPILQPGGTPLIILISSEIHHSPPQVAKNWQAAALCDKARPPPQRVNQEVCWLLLRFSGCYEFTGLRLEEESVLVEDGLYTLMVKNAAIAKDNNNPTTITAIHLTLLRTSHTPPSLFFR